MAKKSINELTKKTDQVEALPAEIPPEYSPAPPPPYPGRYHLRTPPSMAAIYDEFEATIRRGDQEKTVTRVAALFDKDDPLTIVNSPGGNHNGEPLQTRISNAERNRAKRTDPPLLLSDGTYFLRALGEKPPANGDNAAFVTLMVKQANKEFMADWEWSGYCNPERQIYVDSEGALVPAVDEANQPLQGCGERYYLNQWPRGADGKYLERLTCKCGASLRPFGALRNFSAVK